MFDTTDQRFHAKSKRMVAGFYSMSGVVQFEPLVDSTIKVFMKELDRRYATTLNVCPFHSWLNYFAFDVIGEMTFSRRLGFLERGVDVEGIISKIKTTLQYFTVVSLTTTFNGGRRVLTNSNRWVRFHGLITC